MMPLVLADVGTTGRIQVIYGDEDMRNHLEKLGFTVDTEIGVVAKAHGNIIVTVRDTRVAISNDLAKKIML